MLSHGVAQKRIQICESIVHDNQSKCSGLKNCRNAKAFCTARFPVLALAAQAIRHADEIRSLKKILLDNSSMSVNLMKFALL